MSVCFTTAEGPARVGSLCALPFSYLGKEYTACASLLEAVPIGLDVKGGDEFPSSWCPTVSKYNETVSNSWGFCGSCIDQAIFDGIPDGSSAAKKFTLSGCVCADVWKLPGYEPCKSGCCAPDEDERPWCVSEDPTCEGSGWGYCKGTHNLQASALPESTWFDNVQFVTDVTHSPTQVTEAPSNQPNTLQPTDAGQVPTQAPTRGDTSASPSTDTPTIGPIRGQTLSPSVPLTEIPSTFEDTSTPTFNDLAKTIAPSGNQPSTFQPTQQSEDQVPVILLTLFLLAFFAVAAIVATRRLISMYGDRDGKKREQGQAETPDANVGSTPEPSESNNRKSLLETLSESWKRAFAGRGTTSGPLEDSSATSETRKTTAEMAKPEDSPKNSWSSRLWKTAERGKQSISKIYAKTAQGIHGLVEKSFPKPETEEPPFESTATAKQTSETPGTFAADQT